jgi:MEMO1 family protein
MTIRRRSLPMGWYPDDPETVRKTLSAWLGARSAPPRSAIAPGQRAGAAPAPDPGLGPAPGLGLSPAPVPAPTAAAVVAPHAGWAFSGRLAAAALAGLAPAPTIAVIGGHLSGREPPLAAPEDGFETPLGDLASDLELREALRSELARRGLALGEDDEADNTVEVQLPLVAALFPDARVLWLRAPNGRGALVLGEALHAAAAALGRPLSCVGSTDLTHYGPAYGFSPRGRGAEAEAWVRQENDRRFIDALLALDGGLALELGERERSACSSGAAAAALSFARAAGASRAALIEYATSLDVRSDSSFVGYAAIGFYREG